MHLNLFPSISDKFPLRAHEFARSGRCHARPFPRCVDSIYESLKMKKRITKQFQISTWQNSPWISWSAGEFSSAQFVCPGSALAAVSPSLHICPSVPFWRICPAGVSSRPIILPISLIFHHSSPELRCASYSRASQRRALSPSAPATLHLHIKGEAPSTKGWILPHTERASGRATVSGKKEELKKHFREENDHMTLHKRPILHMNSFRFWPLIINLLIIFLCIFKSLKYKIRFRQLWKLLRHLQSPAIFKLQHGSDLYNLSAKPMNAPLDLSVGTMFSGEIPHHVKSFSYLMNTPRKSFFLDELFPVAVISPCFIRDVFFGDIFLGSKPAAEKICSCCWPWFI